jgi:hypothetical protein
VRGENESDCRSVRNLRDFIINLLVGDYNMMLIDVIPRPLLDRLYLLLAAI